MTNSNNWLSLSLLTILSILCVCVRLDTFISYSKQIGKHMRFILEAHDKVPLVRVEENEERERGNKLNHYISVLVFIT